MTKMKTVLTADDFDFIIATLSNVLLEIVEKREAKQEEMYDIIEIKLHGVLQALQSSCAVSTLPLPLGELDLGDEPTQLHQLADVVKARLHHVQEETEQETQALKEVQGVIVEQRRVIE
jgi:hypothetical protein